MKAICRFALVVVVVLAFGCLTTGNLNTEKIKNVKRTVYISEHLNRWEQRHISSVKKLLEKYGYQIVQTREQSELYLDFVIEGGVTITARIALLKNQEELVSSESSNYGWGTVIARPIAVAGRVKAVLEDFETKLKTINESK